MVTNTSQAIMDEYVIQAAKYSVDSIDRYQRNIAQWQGEMAERQENIDATTILLNKAQVLLATLREQYPKIVPTPEPEPEPAPTE